MKSLITIDGNLLRNDRVEVAGHQANCQNTFGSGIARTIREMYPTAYEADTLAARDGSNHLGNFSYADIPLNHRKDGSRLHRIYNLYGQNLYGKGTRQTNYDALYTALEGMRYDIEQTYLNTWPSIGFPYKMGSDRGGGSWDVVSRLIEVAFDGYEGEVLIYRLDQPVP